LKKISIIITDLRGGGTERLHIYLAKYWHELGYKVNFVLMEKKGELIDILPEGVEVVDLGVRRLRHVVWPLIRYINSVKPDIIIAAVWPLTSIAFMSWFLAGKPGRMYLSEHSHLSTSCKHEINTAKWLIKLIMRISYPFASGIVAVSAGVKSDLCKLARLHDSKVNVIYNPSAIGVSPHQESIAIRQQLWGVGFDNHILSVGALKEQKDHVTLIKAFSQLPASLNAKLTILGEGSIRLELEKLITQLGLVNKVAMPGFVLDPYTWFRSADLFVLSSRWEGFGNVIVEALECGVPVVSTDCQSGPAEILKNGLYGELVPIQNPNALAKAMAKSLNKTHDREALLFRASDFSVEKIANEYLDLFLQ
jgi:glycosyltransferase involved in cell wall biosynthesis